MAVHQAPPSLGFSRQEHWSWLPFPSPMHESEKWKWSHSAMSDTLRPHGLQPSRLLHPWDFPCKSTGVGCHLVGHKYEKKEMRNLQTLAKYDFRSKWRILTSNYITPLQRRNVFDNVLLISFSHVWLFANLWTIAHQSPWSMGFSRQEYWSGLLCPHPGDLPNTGIEITSLKSCIVRQVLYH